MTPFLGLKPSLSATIANKISQAVALVETWNLRKDLLIPGGGGVNIEINYTVEDPS